MTPQVSTQKTDTLTELALLRASIEVITRDLGQLNETVGQTLRDQAENLRLLQNDHITRAIQVDNLVVRIDKIEQANQETIKAFDERLKAIEKLAPTINAIMWVGAVFGTSAIALIWAIIIGQASVVFR